LKIVLLGYARGLISSRKIERACRENVIFIASACGQQPDHSTIAAFVSSMKEEILPLFRNVLLVCQEMGLLGGTFFALDGVKLPSNASTKWSGTYSELHRKKARLEAEIEQLLEEHIQEDQGNADRLGTKGSYQATREKQVQRLQKQAERLERWLQENQAKYGFRQKEISSNVTDNDSAKMRTCHCVVQGYNSQALTDGRHQVIIHAEAFGRDQDHAHAPPMLEGALENFKSLGHREDYFAGKTFTADTNYHSETNIRKCLDLRLDAYIPDLRFRRCCFSSSGSIALGNNSRSFIFMSRHNTSGCTTSRRTRKRRKAFTRPNRVLTVAGFKLRSCSCSKKASRSSRLRAPK
jgi:hypothetical protein